MPSTLKDSDYPQFLEKLNERVIENFPNNPMIKPIKYTEETVEDQGIAFNVKLL